MEINMATTSNHLKTEDVGSVAWKNELLKGEREKTNNLKIIKMEVI